MPRLGLSVQGMRCRGCVRKASRVVRDVPGVETVTADSRSETVVVTGSMSADEVVAALASVSFVATVTHFEGPGEVHAVFPG